MKVFRPRTAVASSSAVLAILFAACTAAPTSPLPTETAAPIPTSTPAPAAQVSPTPARLAPTTKATTQAATQATTQAAAYANRVFIQLTDPLDEPEFYCMDVPGAGPGVRLESDLQAHTCKPIATAADELFTIDHPNEGQIYMEAYDLCVEAEGARNGSALRLQPCSDSNHQVFVFVDDLIRLSGTRTGGLCVAVAPGSGIPTGGPSHLRRALTLEVCDTIDPTLIMWSVGLFEYR